MVERFENSSAAVKSALDDYCNQLSINDQEDQPIGNNQQEHAAVDRLQPLLAALAGLTRDPDWLLDRASADKVNETLNDIQQTTSQLPSYLYKRIHDLLNASMKDNLCPAICMTEGCDHTTEMESDQDAGYCEACGGNTMVSALVLAGLI